MAQPRQRRSDRLRNRRQSQGQIVGRNGVMAVGQRANAVNQNALAVAHPPPWKLKVLQKKRVIALESMITAYGIVRGHRWFKQDMVKALFDFGQQHQPDPEPAQPEQEQPDTDPLFIIDPPLIPAPDNVMNMDSNQEDDDDIILLDENELKQEIEQQQQQLSPNHEPNPGPNPEASSNLHRHPNPDPNPNPNQAADQPPEQNGENDDDDAIMDDINRALPAREVERDASVMGVHDDQDEVTRFCIEHNIAQHLPIFRKDEFDLVTTLVDLSKDELMEMGLKRGQAMTLGLFGLREPNFAHTLQDAIANDSE